MESVHLAFDENSETIPCVEFDYDSIDPNVPERNGLTPEDIDRTALLLRKLLDWIWQDGSKDARGIELRAIVICWIFLEHLRPLQLTELANGFGRHKQSLGRHVDSFKKCFPFIKTPHMR